MLTEQFDEDTPPEYVAANERLYKALGLMPQDGDLRDLTLDLLSGGVAGFYRDDQDKLYVVSRSGGIGGNEKITYAHEYGHALQDQTWTGLHGPGGRPGPERLDHGPSGGLRRRRHRSS